MAHYGTVGSHRFSEDVDDIRGTTVRGLEDEKIGTIDDVIFDHGTGEIRYVVIDSGGWLKSRRFLIMASRIFASPERPDEFQVGVTKQQIENLPPYDEKSLRSQEDLKKYEEEYKKAWHEGPVQHRHGSDRNITPPDDELEPAGASGETSSGGSTVTAADLYPDRITDKFSDPTPSGGKVTLRPAGTASRAEDASKGVALLKPRLDAFEALLRRNQVDIRAKCPQCETAPEKQRDVA